MKKDTTNWKRHEFPSIGEFGAVALTCVADGGHWMDFRASLACGEDDAGPMFRAEDNDFTNDVHKAEADWEGHVKWDGCSNFSKDDPDCMFHVCDRADVEALAALILAVYDLGKTEIPKWDL